MAGITKIERERRDRLYERGLKECAVDGEVHHIRDFGPQSDGYQGLKGACRRHANVRTAVWQQTNPDKANAKVRRWLNENPDKARAISKRYGQSDKGRATLERRLERYDGLTRPQREQARLAREQEWAEKRAARRLEQSRRRAERQAAREARLAADALVVAERTARKAERAAYLHLYGPLIRRLNAGKWRALNLFATRADHIWPETLLAYWDANGIASDRCYYTGEPLDMCEESGPRLGWHLDHMTPLSRGGAHTVENIVPCTAAANQDKHERTAEEYLEELHVKAA